MNLSLARIASQLHFPPDGQSLCADWDAAMQSNPINCLPFLHAEYITQSARDVFLTDDMIRELIAFASRVASDKEIGRASCRERV